MTLTLPLASSMRTSTAPAAPCIRYADGSISKRTGRLILTWLVSVREAMTTTNTRSAATRHAA